MDVRAAGRLDNLFERCVGPAVRDVLGDGSVEEVYILLNQAYRLAQAPLRDASHILPVNADGTVLHIV